MYQSRITRMAIGCLVVTVGAMIGCEQDGGGAGASSAQSADVSAQRAKLVLDEKPDGAIGVIEAKRLAKELTPVVLTGTIDAGGKDPWEPGKSQFIITDSSIGEHGAHDPTHDDNCPFCKKKKRENLAIVKFKDDSGEAIEIDARELFEVEQGQVVIITGKAKVDEQLGTMMVDATGIFVEK